MTRRRDPYLKVLQGIFNDNSPPPPTTATRAKLEARIAEITEALRGPMPNVDRLDAVEARQMLRKQLEGMPL